MEDKQQSYARPWWALRTSSAYQGAKRIYKYTTSFPGTYCLARLGENTAEGALRLTGVKDRLHLEEPADAAESRRFKRAPNMTSIDYNLGKGLTYIDTWIDGRLANPKTVEGKVLRVGTSVGLWVAERVPFGSVFVPALEDMDPDHQGPRIEFISAPEVTETPTQTGKERDNAKETPDVEVEVAGEEEDEDGSMAGLGEEGEGPEDDATANEGAGGSDAGSGGGMAAAVSSSSLTSLTEPSEAEEKKTKRPKNKARRLLRSVGHSFKKAINYPKSPASTEEGAVGQESGASAPTKATYFPVTPKAAATQGTN